MVDFMSWVDGKRGGGVLIGAGRWRWRRLRWQPAPDVPGAHVSQV